MAIILPITTEADVHAVRACMGGTADADQQQRAMRWIVNQVCRRLDSPWRPGELGAARETDFEAGRHWAGVTIADMTTPKALEDARATDQQIAKMAAASLQQSANRARRTPKRGTEQ